MSTPWPKREQDGPLRLGVLVSGGGTNLQAILDAANSAAYEVAVVISNRPGAYALERARAANVPALTEPHRAHPDRAAFERALLAHLRAHDVEVVVLAGFMRLLTPTFIGAFERRIVNVHPALCPAFPGLHAARQALQAGARITGCTVHFVDAGVDTGPILAQAAVPVLPEDTEETLQARIQTQEHKLLPLVLDALAQGRVQLEGGRVFLCDVAPSAAALSWTLLPPTPSAVAP